MSVSRKQQLDATIARLCERFPKTFFMLERKRVPLKVGIYDDLVAALGGEIARWLIKAALKEYVWNLSYRQSQLQNRPRLDLNGEPCGEVSEADARSAASDVAARAAIYRERKRLAKAQAKAAAPVKETSAPPSPPPAPPLPKRLGLADLRAAAQRRKEATA